MTRNTRGYERPTMRKAVPSKHRKEAFLVRDIMIEKKLSAINIETCSLQDINGGIGYEKVYLW